MENIKLVKRWKVIWKNWKGNYKCLWEKVIWFDWEEECEDKRDKWFKLVKKWKCIGILGRWGKGCEW
jgi:hypothetical protein